MPRRPIRPRTCRICGSDHDVRSDGRCEGCYDAVRATLSGMSYGKHINQNGHNYLRDAPLADIITCPICGNVFQRRKKTQVYCSDVCRNRAQNLKQNGAFDDALVHNTCRGCRNHIPGSCLCTSRESPYGGKSWNKSCEYWRRPGGEWRKSKK